MYALCSSSADLVRTQVEAGAVALGSFYASSLSSGISNMIKLLQPSMTGTSEKKNMIKDIGTSFLCFLNTLHPYVGNVHNKTGSILTAHRYCWGKLIQEQSYSYCQEL